MPTNEISPYTYRGTTVSICPDCHRTLPASISERDGRMYMRKTCPEHGRFVTLVASNARMYLEAQERTSPTYLLGRYQTRTASGCPQDCGVCPEHEQNNSAPVIEITSLCNLDCPICFGGEKLGYVMEPAEFERCLDVLEGSGSAVDVLILTGGEPTAHPRLLDLVDVALRRPAIPAVAIATNGILLGRREELARGLAERGVYVLLQLDSMDPGRNRVLRGRDMVEYRERAFEMLEKHDVRTTVLMTAVRGLNDDEIGDLLRLSLEKKCVTGFEVQTMAYTGAGGRTLPFDPAERLTGTDLVDMIAAQSRGLLRATDLAPMPHPHPHCISIAYLLRLVDGSFLPFTRFTDSAAHRRAIEGHFLARPSDEHESLVREVIDWVWARRDSIEKGPLVLETLRRILDDVFPQDRKPSASERLGVMRRYVRNVFLHNVMDDHSLDAGVLRKCTSMQVLPDGRMIPHCSYRIIHRKTDPRWKNRAAGPRIGHGVDGLRSQIGPGAREGQPRS